jgi:hypothetical protein
MQQFIPGCHQVSKQILRRTGKRSDYYIYLHEYITLEKLFNASDQIMPIEPAHVGEEEEECEEETDGTLITMETTLGLDKSVS